MTIEMTIAAEEWRDTPGIETLILSEEEESESPLFAATIVGLGVGVKF